MTTPDMERDLLLGILALNNRLVSEARLLSAMRELARDPSRRLVELLTREGTLSPRDVQSLESMLRDRLDGRKDVTQALGDVVSLAPESIRTVCTDLSSRTNRGDRVQAPTADLSQQPADGATLHTLGRLAPRDGAEPQSRPVVSGPCRYRSVRLHAGGGLGEVFVAHDEELNREVALKEIKAHHAGDPGSRTRFLQEAEITGQLEHPGIVPVYGLGAYPDGRPYYAMRFIRGETLSKAIHHYHHENPLKADATRRMMELRGLLKRFQDICDAVGFAHSKGIIHRDLKPDNVILGPFGETLVIDWGLAKAVGVKEVSVGDGEATVRLSGGDGDASHTQAGDVLGTPAYMPPEQAAGRLDNLGPAADIYSLGGILYAVLVGRPPIEGGTIGETLERVQQGRIVPPRRIDPTIHPALEAVCLKALSLNPQDRYASAKDLGREIDRWAADEPVVAYREPLRTRLNRWCRRHPALLTGSAALLFTALFSAAVGSWLLSREQDRTLDEQKARLRAQKSQIEEQENAEKARQDNAVSRVDALLTADAGAVPLLLQELAPFHEWVVPRLKDILERPRPDAADREAVRLDRRHRTRAALALIEGNPNLEEFLVERLLEEGLDPEETLLIRDQLAAHGSKSADRLRAEWKKPGIASERRLRALVALAAFDLDDKLWTQASKDVVGPLLAAEPLHVGIWKKGLEPVRLHLIAPLMEAYLGPAARWSPTERRLATGLLKDYARDDVDTLAGLVLNADAEQFASVFPVFRPHGAKAVSLMERALARTPMDGKEPPVPSGLPTPPRESVVEIERALGMVEDRFALCHALPIENLKRVMEAMRESGYRPTRLRPYTTGKGVLCAVVWQRDGRDWKLSIGVTADEVKAEQTRCRQEGFIPADVAGFLPAGAGETQYAVLWQKAAPDENAGLYVGATFQNHKDEQEVYRAEGFIPRTIHMTTGPGGRRYSGVWWKAKELPKNYRVSWDDAESVHHDMIHGVTRLPVDVDLAVGASLLIRTKSAAELLNDAEQALKEKPADATALSRRGLALHRTGMEKRALEDFDNLLKRFPTTYAEGYRTRAFIHARLGREAEAKADMAQFVKLSDRLSRKVSGEALMLAYLGDREGSRRTIERAVAAEPATADMWLELARAQVLTLADLPRQRRLLAIRESVGLWTSPVGTSVWGVVSTSAQLDRGLAALDSDEKSFPERAMKFLHRAVNLGYEGFSLLRTDADFDPVRNRPEFAAILRRGQLDLLYASVSYERTNEETAETSGLDVEAHVVRCRDLIRRGYRPTGLSVKELVDGGTATASVWQRPLSTGAERDALARRQANAACALLHLGNPDRVWSVLAHSAHPDARSHLIHRLGPLKVAVRPILDRLSVEKDVSIRRGIILALGEFTADQLPKSERDRLLPTLLDWYENDPDPGIHSALDWLLRHAKEGPIDRKLDWGGAMALQQIDERLKGRKPDPGHRWFVNSAGHVLAVLDGTKEFLMGSPHHEPGRYANELLHRRRIGRVFAVGTKEVTVGQFNAFLDANPQVRYPYRLSEDGNDRPRTAVSWYDAAMYCRWLSEREGFPEGQMCYPSIPEILKHADGLTPLRLPPDHLSRRGYRLPTEAEWEFADRAGSESARHYGATDDLLPFYAWFVHNSNERTWPVGLKKPNDFGLFDTLGNAFECCLGTSRLQRHGTRGRPVGDDEDLTPLTDRVNKVVRGGCFSYTADNERSAKSFVNRPPARLMTDGFRIARTCDPNAKP